MKTDRLEVEMGLERYGETINLIDDFISDRELATEAFMKVVRYRHPVYDLLMPSWPDAQGAPFWRWTSS